MFRKISSRAGFSIIEVMVVIMIIGILTTLAGNRILAMIARARQAEAKTNLSQIHQLQGTFQLYSDNYAQWGLSPAQAIGYKGDATRNCTITAGTATGVGNNGSGDGAKKLGYTPKGCEDMRYGYGVIVQEESGKERFLAIAYGASNAVARIFPTCDGGGRGTGATISHEKASDYGNLKFTGVTTLGASSANDGDIIGVSEEKVWHHDDIIKACE